MASCAMSSPSITVVEKSRAPRQQPRPERGAQHEQAFPYTTTLAA